MNCPRCNNNMYSASIDCEDGTLIRQYVSGSTTYTDRMENWTTDTDYCTLIHNNTNDYRFCPDCGISSEVT